MDPYEEEQEILRENRAHSTPPSSENGDEEPRNADAAEAEHQPCRPGLQPKLNTVLCREACDAASGIGTFVRAEASLLYEGTTYNWPMAKEEDGFDGAGPFLASRMQTCIANATGAHFQAFSDAIHPEHTTGFETTQPIVKALPDAPRDHDANASDLVVVTGEGRYLYSNKLLSDGTIAPIAYAVCEPSEALLCSTATMHFRTDVACPCGALSMNHTAIAKFNATTGIPSISIKHMTDNETFTCSMQPTNGWEANPSDIGRVLQVSTWPEHEVRALQSKHTPKFVAPYETDVAALALSDKTYKITILLDVLDAKLGNAIVKCGSVAKPALFCVDMNTRLWGMHELLQSTLIDNQISLLCNLSMAMAKRSDDELKLIVLRLSERNENAGWPDLLKPPGKPQKKDGDDDGSEVEDDGDGEEDTAARISKLRNGLLHPHLRSWYDNIAVNHRPTPRNCYSSVLHTAASAQRRTSAHLTRRSCCRLKVDSWSILDIVATEDSCGASNSQT